MTRVVARRERLLANVCRDLEHVPVWIFEVHRQRTAVVLVSELDPMRAQALLGGCEIVDGERDVPEPGRLGLAGGRPSLRLEQPELQPRLTDEDRLVVLGRLIQLRQPEDVPVPRNRSGAVGDVERHVVESLQAHAAAQRSQSAFNDANCFRTLRLITGARTANSSLKAPFGRKSSTLPSSVPSGVGLNV